MTVSKTPRITWLILIGILLSALSLRVPYIEKDLPFFYNEDEAHHFNRLVNMVKEGDLNPHYFHKPSFHFYLRIPVVAASFFWNVAQGHIRSIQEIKTGDPFGLNGYQMSASHPGIVKWNRSFSVALSLLTILATFLITKNLFGSDFPALLAAGLVAVSPGVISESATIGVDVVLALLCVLATYLFLKLEHDHSTKSLVIGGIVCGLAISTKYNAWPVALMPLVAVLCYRRVNPTNVVVSLITPILGFILGSPYILAEIPLFLDHAAYEVWHYKIAGHVGHTGEPGLSQAIFYFNWISNSGIGVGFALLGLAGTAAAFLKRDRKFLIFLSFPVIYFLFMTQQRANFTRNMIVMVPYLGIMAGGFLWILSQQIRHNIKRLLLIFTTPLLLLQPLRTALTQTSSSTPDTRIKLENWLGAQDLTLSDTAIAGNINFQPQIYGIPGVSRIDETKVIPSVLYLLGYDRLVVGPTFQPNDQELRLLHLEHYIEGEKQYGRVISNPEIRVFNLTNFQGENILDRSNFATPACSKEEGFCWINSRLAVVELDLSKIREQDGEAMVDLKLMSPWPKQSVTFSIADWSHTVEDFGEQQGQWVAISLKIPADRLRYEPRLKMVVRQIHSPLSQKVSSDNRRLGVGIKGPLSNDLEETL